MINVLNYKNIRVTEYRDNLVEKNSTNKYIAVAEYWSKCLIIISDKPVVLLSASERQNALMETL